VAQTLYLSCLAQLFLDLMLAQVLRPLRCLGTRLATTSIGTKSTVDNEQHQEVLIANIKKHSNTVFATGDADVLALEFPEKVDDFHTDVISDFPAKAVNPLLGIGSRFLQKLNIDVHDEQHMFAASDAAALSLEPSNTVSSVGCGSFSNGTDPSMQFFWPTDGNQSPWIDMKMYQAPEATYQPPCAFAMPAAGFVMMQPMLVPVYSPFWGMQIAAQQSVSNAASDIPPSTMFPAEAMGVVAQQCGGPLSQAMGGAEEDVAVGTGARRHRRSRRGGAAMRQKLAGAAQPEEVEEFTHAGKEPEQACLLTRGSSGSSTTDRDVDEVASPASSPASEPRVVGRWCDVPVEADQAEDVLFSPILPSAALDATADSTESAVDPMLLELDDGDQARRQFALDWVLSSFWPLALTKRGCRIVQKAIDVGSPAYQQQLVENLHGHVHECVKSPHTNYVLQKFIETMAPERMQFVLTELQGEGVNIARHRFGCRILQRLIEHCPPGMTEPLINEVLADAASLCRHQYGNFIIQHILQHGSNGQRSAIAEVVGADIIRLAKHRIASHVVSCSMVHCPAEDVQRLTHALLHDAGQLSDLSRREYGSFVVREANRAAKLMRT